MATITRDQILARVRRYADMRNSNQGLLDTDLVDMINDALADYYDLLVSVRGHSYFQTTGNLSLVAGTAGYSLPADFYQLSTATLVWGATEQETLRPVVSNRDLANFVTMQLSWERGTQKGYRISGTQGGTKTMTFYPTPSVAMTCALVYIPSFTPLATGSATFDAENAWHKLVSLDVAAEFRGLLGLPSDFVTGRRDEQRARVEQMATERTQDDPAEIVDTETNDSRWYPYPRWNSA